MNSERNRKGEEKNFEALGRLERQGGTRWQKAYTTKLDAVGVTSSRRTVSEYQSEKKGERVTGLKSASLKCMVRSKGRRVFLCSPLKATSRDTT